MSLMSVSPLSCFAICLRSWPEQASLQTTNLSFHASTVIDNRPQCSPRSQLADDSERAAREQRRLALLSRHTQRISALQAEKERLRALPTAMMDAMDARRCDALRLRRIRSKLLVTCMPLTLRGIVGVACRRAGTCLPTPVAPAISCVAIRCC